MRWFFITFVLTLAVFTGYNNWPVPFDHMQKTTVQIVMKKDGESIGHCSGVYLGGEVLTAGHCVKEGTTPYIRTYDSEDLIEAEWVDSEWEVGDNSIKKDIALLKVDLDIPESNVRCNTLSPGTEVFAVGLPKNLQWTITKGMVTTTINRPDFPENAWLQMDMTIDQGNSGGPVFDRFGNVVGIVSHSMVAGMGRMGAINSPHSYAASSEQVCGFLNEH